LAVEIKQYAGQGTLKTLVPRLVGQTATARQRKGAKTPRQEKVDEATFLKEMLESRGPEGCRVARQMVEWARQQRLTPTFIKRQNSASFIPIVEASGGLRYPVSVNTSGNIWVQMRWLRDSAPFRDEARRQVLWQKLNGIPGVEVPPERMTGFPTIPL